MALADVVLYLDVDPEVSGVEISGIDAVKDLEAFIEEAGGRVAFRLTHDEEAEW